MKKSEPSVQFAKIFEEHHNPLEKEKRKIIKNREERESNIKKEIGME